MGMNRKEKKEIIKRALEREEVKYTIEYADNMRTLYIICKEYLEGMTEPEFLELMIELIQEGAPEIGEDFQDIAAGLKVGQLYIDK